MSQVAFVGNNARRIARLQKLAQQRFSADQLTRVLFCTPETLAATLVANTPRQVGKKKICGYDVTMVPPTGNSATGNADQVIHDAVAKALRRQKRKS
jgi:hypothetical protein